MTGTASLYLRLSRESGETSTGLLTQEADLRALAEREGLTVVAVHTDDGYSGALRERPGLRAWLEDGRSGRASALLAWRIDRVTRGGVAALAELLDLVRPQDGSAPAARLLTADGRDSQSSSFGLEVAVMAEVAFAERAAIAARIKRAAAERKRQGRWSGGTPPYGLAVVPNPDGPGVVLAVEPEEAEVLRRVTRELIAGSTLTSIVRRLNDEGVRPRRAAAWSRTTLRQSLTSGPALRQVFDAPTRRALLAALERKPRSSAPSRSDGRLLSGVLVCHGCGERLQLARRSSGAVTYRCQHEGCRARVTVSAPAAEEAVAEDYLRRYGALDVLTTRVVMEPAEGLEDAENAVEALWDALRAAGPSGRAEALQRLSEAEEELARLKALPARRVVIEVGQGGTYGDRWGRGDAQERNRMLRDALAGPVVLLPSVVGRPFSPERLAWSWKLDEPQPTCPPVPGGPMLP